MESKIIWFTGLSGSGKTTLSNYIFKKLKNKKFKIKKIDGDIFREKNRTKKFNKISIIKNNISIINYIDKIKSKYDFILVSVISPLKKTRTIANKKFKKKYYEVYTKCNLKELINRDTKKLYEKAQKNIIKDLIGFNSKINYEMTNYKKIIVNTGKESIKVSANKIIKKIYL
jgi:adenylylsulfate kinase